MHIPLDRQPLIETFLEMNQRINLSAIRTPEGVYTKHILDSLSVQSFSAADMHLQQATTLIDVGTGGGFPLLPLAMTYPHLTCTGLDARKKKCRAIQQMIDELTITNATTVWSRAEDATQQADFVTARAVAYADTLLPRVTHVTRPGGHILLYKLFTTEEDDYLRTQLDKHGCTLLGTHRYTLPEDSTSRVLYLLQKQ